MSNFDTFDAMMVETGETGIFLRKAGSGPALLLLHGFPQTHLMWAKIAPLLADGFTVVCADLRGYGQSGYPPSSPDHLPYSKRAMALDMVTVMNKLGYSRFLLAGHDRGGRVAYRLALDHPDRVERLALLDVVSVADAWEHADKRLATSFWPWSLLAQTAPLPERLIGAAPQAIVDNALDGWGSLAEAFAPEVREAYVQALSDPAHVHAICEEYRAAATIDHIHDDVDRQTGRQIECPVLALWSASGALNQWYEDLGGPLALWRQWARDVSGEAVEGGHFFPEEHPGEIADRLRSFFSRTP